MDDTQVDSIMSRDYFDLKIKNEFSYERVTHVIPEPDAKMEEEEKK